MSSTVILWNGPGWYKAHTVPFGLEIRFVSRYAGDALRGECVWFETLDAAKTFYGVK